MTTQTTPRSPGRQTTADDGDVARFQAIADEWWDATGKFRPLHRINPVRIAFIRDRVAAHFGLDSGAARPLRGLSLLDIGCGGGILAEPLARLGAKVTGIDAGEKNVAVARLHAEQMGLDIDYRHVLPEDLADLGRTFDVVLNMEVVEHVADLDAFLAASADMVRPGGCMVVTTLNRTLKSLMLAKIGAEYVLRWLPPGTHDWRKFVRPSELVRGLAGHGVEVTHLEGMVFNPLSDTWRLDAHDLDVNYLAFAAKG
ncbi:MAG: bifunctional 3-demethylubiquinol 3-O-methyltransferase/2-polyprenyl-6-hydroxyphenol methylase [Rhodospirillales bacterium CG15_BIG_FIL_POST_REV_8_21_14_020_66_15]|nr:MAG: bifunctional 3-demethylubiquinol 3-O-methyltransferase/2-polyprenyl-6-hydroxyphenol methylase [Rhodospirillales bacterium CG15_BIG_FIL_POST_REV_8_21_14_020_66_15]